MVTATIDLHLLQMIVYRVNSSIFPFQESNVDFWSYLGVRKDCFQPCQSASIRSTVQGFGRCHSGRWLFERLASDERCHCWLEPHLHRHQTPTGKPKPLDPEVWKFELSWLSRQGPHRPSLGIHVWGLKWLNSGKIGSSPATGLQKNSVWIWSISSIWLEVNMSFWCSFVNHISNLQDRRTPWNRTWGLWEARWKHESNVV